MNKLFTKIAALALGMTMATGVGVAVASSSKASQTEAATGDTFVKVTDASSIADGDLIIFVKQDGSQACGTTQNTNNRTPVNITVSGNNYVKTNSDNVQEFTVKAGNTSGQFGFHTGSGYIYSAASNSNNLKTNTTAATTKPSGTSAWTISISSGTATVLNVTNTSYYLAFNGTQYFSQYKSGMSKTTIYKRSSASTTYTVNFDKNNDACTQSNPSSITQSSQGAAITLPSAMSAWGYSFGGWNTNKTGTGTNYNAGSSYTPDSDNVTLYGKWSLKTLSAITATTSTPTKTTYTDGEDFDPAGLVIRATFSGEAQDTTVNLASPNKLTWTKPTVGSNSVTGTFEWGSNSETVTISGLTVTKSYKGGVYYSLTPVTGTNSNYGSNCDIVCADSDHSVSVTWNLTGNSQQIPWRIGGNSISNIDRALYSKTAMGSAITKIELELGTISSITVNSAKLEVSSNSSFASISDTVNFTATASSTIEIKPTSGTSWAKDSYYKFTFNVTVSGSSNKFVQIVGADFYTQRKITATINGDPTVSSGVQWSPTGIVDEDSDPVTGATYSFSASGPTITSSSTQTGAFTATGTGTVTVSASAGDVYDIADKEVTVTSAGAYITVDSEISGYTGMTGTLNVSYGHLDDMSSLEVISDDDDIASAEITSDDENGNAVITVSFNDEGDTFLTISADSGDVEETCDVSVTSSSASNLVLSPTSISMGVSEQPTLTATVDFLGELPTISFESSESSVTVSDASKVASDNGDGTASASITISASAQCTAIITVECGEESEDCSVSVSNLVTDTLVRSDTGIASGTTTYSSWDSVSKSSEAVYAGNSAGNNDSIQIRGTANSSGIVSTTSGGTIKKVSVQFEGHTSNGRIINVYGSNDPYESPADLADSETAGTLIGTIVCGTSTELQITDTYAYVGIAVGTANAAYLSSVSFQWAAAAERPISGITVSSPVVSSGWYAGDTVSLAKAGVTVTANYSDGQQPATEDVTAKATITSSTTLAQGSNTISVSYRGQTGSFTLTAAAATTYTQISDITDLVHGRAVYFGATSGQNHFFMGGQDALGYRKPVDGITITSGTVQGTIEVERVIVGTNQNGYYFTDAHGKYLTYGSSQLTQSDSLDNENFTTYWSVSFSGSVATISSKAASDHHIAYSSNRFASYTLAANINIFVENYSTITSSEKVITFSKLYMHMDDVPTTNTSDTGACRGENGYFAIAKAALDGEWSSIASAFASSGDMWQRYVDWGTACGVSVSFSNNSIDYNKPSNPLIDAIGKNGNVVAIVVIMSVISISAIGGYFFLRKRKEEI